MTKHEVLETQRARQVPKGHFCQIKITNSKKRKKKKKGTLNSERENGRNANKFHRDPESLHQKA